MEPEQKITDLLKPPSEGGIYTDLSLIAALRHAESGQLAELRGEIKASGLISEGHDVPAFPDHKWLAASMAYARLGETDEERRAKLIPLIKAEIMRRAAETLCSEMEVSEVETV